MQCQLFEAFFRCESAADSQHDFIFVGSDFSGRSHGVLRADGVFDLVERQPHARNFLR